LKALCDTVTQSIPTTSVVRVSAMRIALFQPDIPQNVGAILRLGACLGVPVDIIEPCGFLFDDRRLRRAGMDYLAQAALDRHRSWERFLESRRAIPVGRLLLLTTAGDIRHTAFRFRPGDTLLLGQESAGVPAEVHAGVDARLRVAMRPGLRSLNLALAAALVLGEALRQIDGFPADAPADQDVAGTDAGAEGDAGRALHEEEP